MWTSFYVYAVPTSLLLIHRSLKTTCADVARYTGSLRTGPLKPRWDVVSSSRTAMRWLEFDTVPRTSPEYSATGSRAFRYTIWHNAAGALAWTSAKSPKSICSANVQKQQVLPCCHLPWRPYTYTFQNDVHQFDVASSLRQMV